MEDRSTSAAVGVRHHTVAEGIGLVVDRSYEVVSIWIVMQNDDAIRIERSRKESVSNCAERGGITYLCCGY